VGHLLAIVLPLALGAALTPTIVAVQLVTLTAPEAPLRRSWTLAAGCAVVLLGESALALALAGGTGWSDGSSEPGAIVKLVAAALLVVLGVWQLRKRHRGHTAPPPKSKEPRLGRTFAIGAALMATNFSSLVLYFPAMHEIGSSDAGTTAQLVAFVLLFAITMLPAAGPPLLVGLLGERARPPLERLNRLFTEHRDTIGALVCFGFAVLLTVFALNALS
jgi:threonine/homoserine/homoserine lactone efflux protein